MSDDPEREIELREDELSPHQRALTTVLRLWMRLSVPASIVAALVIAVLVAPRTPGSIDAGVLLLVYFGVGMPSSIALFKLQTRARRAIARRVLAQLDAPVRGAISGRESTMTFAATRSDSEPEP